MSNNPLFFPLVTKSREIVGEANRNINACLVLRVKGVKVFPLPFLGFSLGLRIKLTFERLTGEHMQILCDTRALIRRWRSKEVAKSGCFYTRLNKEGQYGKVTYLCGETNARSILKRSICTEFSLVSAFLSKNFSFLLVQGGLLSHGVFISCFQTEKENYSDLPAPDDSQVPFS